MTGTRDEWAEFLKCIDLYSQDLLYLSEVFQLTTALFRSRGLPEELLGTFVKFLKDGGTKCHGIEDRCIAPRRSLYRARGCDEKDEGSDRVSFLWASTPLHEIDFSRCKHATPSYRALPTSMSRPRCSGRLDLDLGVLNDVWVSQPVGSEENSFTHVRKSFYEEEIFKCEDERFELDMIVDANSATIAILELINAEIQRSSSKTTPTTHNLPLKDIRPAKEDITSAPGVAQLIGFTIGPIALSTANLNAILRVYGEHGACWVPQSVFLLL